MLAMRKNFLRFRINILRYFHFLFEVLGINLEKIEFQGFRNSSECIGVNACLLENIIHIRTLTVNLTCQPRRRPLLPPQLRIYQIADMHH